MFETISKLKRSASSSFGIFCSLFTFWIQWLIEMTFPLCLLVSIYAPFSKNLAVHNRNWIYILRNIWSPSWSPPDLEVYRKYFLWRGYEGTHWSSQSWRDDILQGNWIKVTKILAAFKMILHHLLHLWVLQFVRKLVKPNMNRRTL